ncbi:lysozyme inhibitor LprI family protein [Pseudomonas sp. SH1-B]
MSMLSRCLIIALLPLTAWADYDAQYQDCLNANGTINNSIVAGCAEGVSAAVKRDMNRVYQQLFLKLQTNDPQSAEQLEAAQKAWLIYRDGQCDLQGKHVGSPMYYTCLMALNIQRVSELLFLLEHAG